MNFVVETLDNWQEVFDFLGKNVDYQQPFILNLPYLADIWHGSQVGMRLLVASARDDVLKGVAVLLLIDADLEKAREINPRFSPVVSIGNFGEDIEELAKFADDVAQGMV